MDTWDDTKFMSHDIVVAAAISSWVWYIASSPSQLRTCSETHYTTSPRTRSSRNESMQIDIAFIYFDIVEHYNAGRQRRQEHLAGASGQQYKYKLKFEYYL